MRRNIRKQQLIEDTKNRQQESEESGLYFALSASDHAFPMNLKEEIHDKEKPIFIYFLVNLYNYLSWIQLFELNVSIL